MNFQTLSPSDCAADVLKEIIHSVGNDTALKTKLELLIRQKIRLVLEHCAMVAEDYVANNDNDDRLSGEQVGDRIAEEIRLLADERKRRR